MNVFVKFGATFAILLFLCLFVTATLTGWQATLYALGGFLSLVGLLVLLASVALAVAVAVYLQVRQYGDNTARMLGEAIPAVVVIGGLALIGVNSVSLPSGGSLRVILALVFIIAASGGITWLDSRK